MHTLEKDNFADLDHLEMGQVLVLELISPGIVMCIKLVFLPLFPFRVQIRHLVSEQQTFSKLFIRNMGFLTENGKKYEFVFLG